MKPALIPLILVALAFAPVRTQRTPEAAGSAPPLRVSDMGPDGNAAYGAAAAPAMAYNPNANEYLVVWSGDDETDGEFEIYGQRLDAATGREVGPNDFRISHVGTDGDASRLAYGPSVAFNVVANQYLVVWTGNGNPGYANDWDVYGQRLSADGTEIAADFMLAPTPTAPYEGYCNSRFPVWCQPSQWRTADATVAYDAERGGYLLAYVYGYPVTWVDYGYYESVVVGRLDTTAADASEAVMDRTVGWGRFSEPVATPSPLFSLAAVAWTASGNIQSRILTGDATMTDRVTISAMSAGVSRPRIAYSSTADEFLVVWQGQHQTLPEGEPQVFGQRLSRRGEEIGADDFRISNAPPTVSGILPDVAYDAFANEYLVVWTGARTDATNRVFAQRLSASGAELGVNDTVLTPAGHGVSAPALVYDTRGRRHFAAWAGTAPQLVNEGTEIFGTFYEVPDPIVVGLGRGGGEYQSWQITSDGFDRDRTQPLPWSAYNAINGELHPAMGDVDGDGLDEIVLGLSTGGDGWIAIMDDARHANALLTWVRLPWPGYNTSNGTIWPAVGDIDGDGKDEIVAGLGAGGQGWFAIFDDAAHGYALMTWRRVSWPSYNATQSGETHPAVVNIDGGSFSEVVIGLGAGGAGWMELIDDAAAAYAHMRWLRVGWGDYVGGPGETYPAAGDVDGDGYGEIVVGLGATGQGWLQVFDDAFTGVTHKAWLQVTWPAYAAAAGETHPAVGNVDGDAPQEIVLGLGVYPGEGGWFEIRDDFTNAFASLGWRNVGRADLFASGAATFPAIGRAP